MACAVVIWTTVILSESILFQSENKWQIIQNELAVIVIIKTTNITLSNHAICCAHNYDCFILLSLAATESLSIDGD